ncbi:hypothetical protein [Flavobacterium subsaxonicum]|uniref:Uncharacterized protein n=1 Tax=Flavobacterium subsaxonicum WB 4.1-42 = DSM 21790 TaxID=1121898 RepID=A0A0A2MS73_9FLAO|nr:hypothetical protein [Flavobacterium subsaxonicum]KGO94303.1 hypothetical protein Q766_05120 [Flavobacterium subsaxonicum WB 4.1-42 = DSM 21790]
MSQLNDNPGQGNRGGQEYGEATRHQSSRNQDSQKHETTPEEEKLKQEHNQEIPADEKEEDKFSPGEAEEYNPDDFATD